MGKAAREVSERRERGAGKLSRVAAVVVGAGLVCLGGLFLMRNSMAMLGTVHFEPGMVRPRSRPVLNPFRDRGPERACEALLARLRDRRVEDLIPLLESQWREHFLIRERPYPILNWRIGRREVGAEGGALMYWVRRGGGYPEGEEEVFFEVKRTGPGIWRVEGYQAVY